MALLEVSNLGIAFGGLQAVAQLDLSIEKGHLYGLIGPNGAGKTTVFNMLTGVYKPTEGNIILDGKDITGKNPELISKAGVARTFQNIRLFNEMSVLDNVKVGLHNQIKYGMWTGILRLPAFKEKEHEMNREAMKLLKIFDLDKEADYKASQLPYGKPVSASGKPAGIDASKAMKTTVFYVCFLFSGIINLLTMVAQQFPSYAKSLTGVPSAIFGSRDKRPRDLAFPVPSIWAEYIPETTR